MQSLVVTDNRSESYISFLSIFSKNNQPTGDNITCATIKNPLIIGVKYGKK